MRGLNSVELRYWEDRLSERMDSALKQLYELAPWLAPALEPEFRVCMRDPTFTPLMAELSKVPALGELADAYDRIRERVRERLSSSRPLYPMLRDVLEQLLRQLPAARDTALGSRQPLRKHRCVGATVLRRYGLWLPFRRKSPAASHRLQRGYR